MNLIHEADIFAEQAHGSIGQTRKFTGDPYITHPREVAAILAAAGMPDTVVAAGLLHDVREDVPWVTYQLLKDRFGPDVADLVEEVTDVSRPEDGARSVRKAMERAHLASISDYAQTVKVADIASNGRTVLEHDRKFARLWLPEKLAALAVLTRADRGLHDQARNLIESAIEQLKGA